MEEEKLKQNEERLWIYLFHTLGLSFDEASLVLSRLILAIQQKQNEKD